MSKTRKYLWISALTITIIIIALNTFMFNHNWAYRDIIHEMESIPNGEYITDIDISEGITDTNIDVIIECEDISQEDMIIMVKDLQNEIDENIYYDMEESRYVGINPLAINLGIRFSNQEIGYGIYREYDHITDTYSWRVPD